MADDRWMRGRSLGLPTSIPSISLKMNLTFNLDSRRDWSRSYGMEKSRTPLILQQNTVRPSGWYVEHDHCTHIRT